MAIADGRMTGTEVVHKSHMNVGVFKRCNIEALKSLQSAYYISKPHGLRMSIKFVLCFALYTIYIYNIYIYIYIYGSMNFATIGSGNDVLFA